MNVVLAIMALGVLVVVHEAGHFFVARWSKMRVERFSIGFGPAMLKWRSRETQFQLAPVPFGGFVQITGMNPHEEFDEKDPLVYPNRPAILRFLVILAGPAMNYVLAVALMFVYYLSIGVAPTTRHKVGRVEPGRPASAILQPGDVLLKVNGVDVWASDDESLPEFASQVQKTKNQPVVVEFERAGHRMFGVLKPTYDNSQKDDRPYKVGVVLLLDAPPQPVGVGRAVRLAIVYPIDKTTQILDNLRRVIRREVPGGLSGPVGIVDAMQSTFSAGWEYGLQLVAMLSVMLGLFNLLPIPGLDGGRLAFLGYELATRRRPNPKVEATVHMFGILVLFLVLIVVTFNDISKVIAKWFA